jgi:hypothetical protein
MATQKVTKEEKTKSVRLYVAQEEVLGNGHIPNQHCTKYKCWISIGEAFKTTMSPVKQKVHNLQNNFIMSHCINVHYLCDID